MSNQITLSKHPLFFNFLILFLAMFIGGCIAIILGKELSWDLANYHFYTPYAFFNNRYEFDYWPNSFLHQFINPSIDFISYFLIQYTSPVVTEFILGAIHGINIWLLFAIGMQILNIPHKTWFALALASVGINGPIAFPEIGSLQNDSLISIFVLANILLTSKFLTEFNHRATNFLLIFCAGFLLGIGVGLKLTAAIFVFGTLAIVFTSLPYKIKLKIVLINMLGCLCGFLLTAGHWQYFLWIHYQNPVFPFFNALFHSTHFANINWHDLRFIPQTFYEKILFPFLFSWDGRTSEVPFFDLRFSILYILLIANFVKFIFYKIYRISNPLPISQQYLFLFCIISYIVWQYYFAIARYFVAVEMLVPLLIFLSIMNLCKSFKLQILFITTIFYSLTAFMMPASFVRTTEYGPSFFNVILPSFVKKIPKATVLVAFPAYMNNIDPRPQNYLIPFFPQQWQFIGIPFSGFDYFADDQIDTTIHKKIADQNSPIFLLTTDYQLPGFIKILSHFNLKLTGKCAKIANDRQRVTQQESVICYLVTQNH